MEAEQGANESIRFDFQNHIDQLNTAPEWWQSFKSESFESYSNAPLPGRTDENWRFANRKGLDLDAFSFGPKDRPTNTDSLVEKSDLTSAQSGSLVFANNHTLAYNKASQEHQDKGVIWSSLQDALVHNSDLLKDYFMKQDINLGSEKFAHLHSAFVTNGAFLYIPKGVEIEAPFCSYNWASAENGAIFPHMLVIAEEFSKVSIAEAHLSAGSEPALSCGVTHLFAGVGAKIDYTLIQNFNEQTLGFQINSNIAGKDSEVKMNSVNIGCHRYRSETHGQIKGPGAHVDMRSLALVDSDQEIDQRTLQTHSAPHTTSNLLFKNALKQNAKTIFSGLIKVDECAQLTDAYQTNRNLLLSNTAEANSLPGLEIEANDVKCSHGATTSEIQDEEIFYMLARGIPKEAAQELIVYGFFEEILDCIKDEKLAETAREIIREKFKA